MQRVLILTAGYGEGHNAAARALAAGLQEAGAEAEVRDLFLEAYGDRQRLSSRMYLQCIDRAPWIWAIVYFLLDRLPLMRWFIAPSLFTMQARLARLLAEWQPAAVVCVYPGYNYVLDRIFHRKPRPFKLHTLVTDSITVNSLWYRAGSDDWLVPNEDTAAVLRTAGVPAHLIHATGFPVPLIFAGPAPERPEPGAGEPLRVLAMVNQIGPAGLQVARGLLLLDGVKVTATVGKNEALGRQLAALAASLNRPLEIFGWTSRMPELLRAHHILIGKAGGAATQESLAACTPLLITKIVPGQEEGNAELIQRHACGAVTTTPGAILHQVEELTAHDCALWKQWQMAIQKISRPEAARVTARHILGGKSGSM
jgi:processive 1,2-diacylglycerol beta-glucosyltransferase